MADAAPVTTVGATSGGFRNAHAAPISVLSAGPPTRAVLASADSVTLNPKWPSPTSPLPVSFAPCCSQVEPERVKTHAAPTPALSLPPPISAVSPSADSPTLKAKRPSPTSPAPVSLGPCWVHVSPAREKTHAAPTPPLSAYPP